jgi:outer membrane protein assembly factor BamA
MTISKITFHKPNVAFITQLIFLCLLLSLETTTAQIPFSITFKNTKTVDFFSKNIKIPIVVQDSFEGNSILRGALRTCQQLGYLAAAFDSVNFSKERMTAQFYLGERYLWANLRNGNIEAAWLEQVGFRERLLDGKPLVVRELFDFENKLLVYAENNGYPFAQVWLDSISVEEGNVSAALMMKTGRVFQFDTLEIIGFAKISPLFLQNYLDLKQGQPFSRAQFLRIQPRLTELPYLTLREAPKARFSDVGKAIVSLLLDNRKASQWDFLVGVQPTTLPDGAQKFSVTFNGKADFQNLLGKGERFFANFENLRPQSPRLNVKATYPFIFNLPFGFDGAFDLYKRDTTYLETYTNLGAQYLLGGSDYIKLFWQNYRANNLLINELEIVARRQLPPTLDVNTNMVGLELARQKLDYRFNPRRGFAFILRGGAGLRQVRKNLEIVNLGFENLYDTVALRNFQYRLEAKADYYLPVLRRATVKLSANIGSLLTAAPIAQNEQYRIGGNRLLRGFDEESLFATRYAIGTVEYRLLVGRNSYFYTFGDFGFVQNFTQKLRIQDTPLGFGAGMTFETRVGLFGVTLALGRQLSNPIDFRNVKTHFGYVSLF